MQVAAMTKDQPNLAECEPPEFRPPRHTSSKYDFVKVRVWLGENSDHYYVLSRFLISRMLTVTRIPAVVAIKIALELKKLLVDASLLDVSQVDLEANLFVLMNRRGYGEEYVNRYKMMTEFYHQRIPLIILVCGTACIGKSTIATQLSQRFNLPNVLQTDIVYELLRTSPDAPLVSSPVWARDFDSPEELIAEFCRECRIVRKGLEGDMGKAVRDGKPIIIEGEHIDPALFLQSPQGSAIEATVLPTGPLVRSRSDGPAVAADRTKDMLSVAKSLSAGSADLAKLADKGTNLTPGSSVGSGHLAAQSGNIGNIAPDRSSGPRHPAARCSNSNVDKGIQERDEVNGASPLGTSDLVQDQTTGRTLVGEREGQAGRSGGDDMASEKTKQVDSGAGSSGAGSSKAGSSGAGSSGAEQVPGEVSTMTNAEATRDRDSAVSTENIGSQVVAVNGTAESGRAPDRTSDAEVPVTGASGNFSGLGALQDKKNVVSEDRSDSATTSSQLGQREPDGLPPGTSSVTGGDHDNEQNLSGGTETDVKGDQREADSLPPGSSAPVTGGGFDSRRNLLGGTDNCETEVTGEGLAEKGEALERKENEANGVNANVGEKKTNGEKGTKKAKPIIVPIVLKMDEEDHASLLGEWMACRATSLLGHVQVEERAVLKRLQIIQDYLCSFESQGVAVFNISATTFSKTIDALHGYLLECIELGCAATSNATDS